MRMNKPIVAFSGLIVLTLAAAGVWLFSPPHSTEPSEIDRDLPMTSGVQKSTYEKHTIEDILNDSTDQELVRISGEIIRKIKCSVYLFRGDTGDIQVKIGLDAIPDRGLPFKEAVVVKGTVNQTGENTPVIEADHIRFVF